MLRFVDEKNWRLSVDLYEYWHWKDHPFSTIHFYPSLGPHQSVIQLWSCSLRMSRDPHMMAASPENLSQRPKKILSSKMFPISLNLVNWRPSALLNAAPNSSEKAGKSDKGILFLLQTSGFLGSICLFNSQLITESYLLKVPAGNQILDLKKNQLSLRIWTRP